MFLPIFDISVSISTSWPIFITFKNSEVSEIEMVRIGVSLSMLIVVTTSIMVLNAPPWTVLCIFF